MSYELRLTMEVYGQEKDEKVSGSVWPGDGGDKTLELSMGDFAEKDQAFQLRESLFHALRGLVILAKLPYAQNGAP